MHRPTTLLLTTALALLAAAAAFEDYTDCAVSWYRVVVPGKMVYAWNCICFKGDTSYVLGGTRYPALDYDKTSTGQIDSALRCFRKEYRDNDLGALCRSDPGKFQAVADPLNKACTIKSQLHDADPMPFDYTRLHCRVDGSQARQIGMTMIAQVYICTCLQPHWMKGDSPDTHVIDGRAPFPVPLQSGRPDVIDYMQECMAPLNGELNEICRYYPTYFNSHVQLHYAMCCEKYNTFHNTGEPLDCAAIIALG